MTTPQRIYDSAAWTGREPPVTAVKGYVLVDGEDMTTVAWLPDFILQRSTLKVAVIPQDILDIPDGFGA